MIGSYPFKFQGARILSGVEEGAYGWITINYLLSSFIKYSYEGKWLHPKNGKILGALNMGGASTQITFTPEGRIADKQTEASFLKAAFSAFFYTFDFLKLAPQSSLDVTKKTTEEFCKSDWSSVHIGGGAGQGFTAESHFRNNPTLSIKAIAWLKDRLKTDFPTEKENNLREYCATSYYITTLLVDAYICDNQSWNKIIFKKKLRADDPDIGWMLGYTLNLTNLIPTETPVR
ncbi:UNVERIFIED_CONTAM: hypothetical protein FKN15_076012 [Acipenser sinensis]